MSRRGLRVLIALMLCCLTRDVRAVEDGTSRCDAALLPQIDISTETSYLRVAYLELVDASSYGRERKGGKINAIIQDLPIGASYSEFSERRQSYAREVRLDVTREEARSFFRQSLTAEQLKAWTQCITAHTPGVRVRMRDDDRDGVVAEVRYDEGPGLSRTVSVQVVGGSVASSGKASISFNLPHGGMKSLYLRRSDPGATIRVVVNAEVYSDHALSRWPPPVLCSAPSLLRQASSYDRGENLAGDANSVTGADPSKVPLLEYAFNVPPGCAYTGIAIAYSSPEIRHTQVLIDGENVHASALAEATGETVVTDTLRPGARLMHAGYLRVTIRRIGDHGRHVIPYIRSIALVP